MKISPPAHAARLVSIDDISSDTRILKVELENRRRLEFEAGQYVFFHVDGLDARAFSIASHPEDTLLEFHVRNSGHGISAHLFRDGAPGLGFRLSEPCGANIYKKSAQQVLALAGGVGIAPMKSIIHAHFAHGKAPLHLYWGARDISHLYLDNFFRGLVKKNSAFSYIPVLSEVDDGRFRRGFLPQALQEDFPTLTGFDVYMAGPKPMIDALMPVLHDLGAEKERIFSDAFSL